MAAEVEVARGAISIELESRILKQISEKNFITKAFHSEPRKSRVALWSGRGRAISKDY